MSPQGLLKASAFGVLFVEIIGSMLIIHWWRRLGRTGRLAGGWLLAATVFGVLGMLGQYLIRNALIASFFWFPASSILAFNALASIHAPGRSRTFLRILSWFMVLSWVVLALTIEEAGAYSRITSPMHAILLAAAAAYTLITRVESSRTDLLRDSSFVIAAFWLIYAVPTVFLSVAARLWVYTEHFNQVLYYYTFRNTIVICSYFALLYGVRLSMQRGEHHIATSVKVPA